MKRKFQEMTKEQLIQYNIEHAKVPQGYLYGIQNWNRNELMPMADVAESWARKHGIRVPKDRRTKEWKKMYQKWIDYAFEGFGK